MWKAGKIQQHPVCRPRRSPPLLLCSQRGSWQPVQCLATLVVGCSALSLPRIGMGVASPLLQEHASVLPVMNRAVPSAAVPAAGQPKRRHPHGRNSPGCVCARHVHRKCALHHADSRNGTASAEYASHKGCPVEHVGHRRRRRTHQLRLSTATHRHQCVQGAIRLVGAYGAKPSDGPRYQEQPLALPTAPEPLQRDKGGGRIEHRVRGVHIRHSIIEPAYMCYSDWQCSHTQPSVRKPTCTNIFSLGICERRHGRVRRSRSGYSTVAAPAILSAAGAAVSCTGYAARWRGEQLSGLSRTRHRVM